ncbi:MAG: SHOCT domain-containing protein [Thermosediminibacteraceae bacterium]|nr:SHOCT domain-containing protein [Thermosediminibacteraceae bacterium]
MGWFCHGWGFGGMNGTLMYLWMFIWFFFWATAIFLAYRLIKGLIPVTSPAVKCDYQTPFDILKKRYAAGEISREDFEKMKEDLERS